MLRQVFGTALTAIQRDDFALDGQRLAANQKGVNGCDRKWRGSTTVGLHSKKCGESLSLALKPHELGNSTFPIGKENGNKLA